MRPYYARINPDLLARIPLNAKCVLEVGCGVGALGAAFLTRAPSAQYLGIELDNSAAESARSMLSDVLVANVERLGDADLDRFIDGRKIDSLVFGDVLEHLVDPLATLRRLVGRLEPGGAAIACIPNIGHWSILDRLLQGKWSYEDEGLLDRTHLRFFTFESACTLFRDAGLVVTKAAPRNIPLDPKRQSAVVEALGKAAADLGADAAEVARRLRAFQYILVGVKPPVPRCLHVQQLILAPGFMHARVDVPLQAINSLPTAHATNHYNTLVLPKLPPGDPKVIVVQRQIIQHRAEWMAAARRTIGKGWLLIAEWDDHPDLLRPQVKARWDVNAWLPMTTAHAVQVSTAALAEAFSAYNPHVFIVPNGLLDRPALVPKPTDHVRIAIAALNRENANALIGPALERTLDRYPRSEIDIVLNRSLYDRLQARFPRRIRFHEALGYADYLSLLQNSHVGLLPLMGVPAERFKSDLKFQEFSSRGVACIASPTIYESSIRAGVDGLIARSVDDWIQHLDALVADAALREKLATNAWMALEERLQSRLVVERVQQYRELWRRREILTADLLRRHPELA